MNKSIIWITGDSLNPQNSSLQEYPHSPAIWVWDDALIAEWQISLKRLTFIYECLLELPVEIRRGNVAEEIIKFAKEHDANLVVTTDSPSPRFEEICHQIEESLELEIFVTEPFFKYDGFIDLKRFSRYWKVAEKYVFE
ncbi:hypothetical protein [Anabaena sp. UHCC 0451]|uniref:hypothetical protein n=1 Tax=Anabaena sp. UHCC 0451 TaxID=2055235 RepID=UPI002B213E53|nr:hypothetical protein [Anabaena sp. UHCC 0451]MEA5578957.1 hypothetical protein [Anabaena sp. UHCC 0451]